MKKIAISILSILLWANLYNSYAQSNPYMVSDLNTEQDYTVGSNPTHFTLVGTKTYFITGIEASLWVSDGTETGTTQITGISGVKNLVNVNGILYFVATTAAYGEELYKYNGTTLTLIDTEVGAASSSPSALTNVNGTLYFSATTATSGLELYKYAGTDTTATLIEIEAGVDGSNPSNLTNINGTLYFKATTAASGEELYKYASSTLTLIDIETGINSSNPEYLTNVNGTLYFVAYTSAEGTEVRKYTGLGITTTVIDVEVGSLDSYPYELTHVNGALYFVATTAATGTELYRYAGSGTTATLIDIELGGNGSNPTNLTAVNNTLYFTAMTAANGTELYKHDGTNATLIDVEIGIDSSDPDYLTNVNGVVYFIAYTLANGDELYKYDGSTTTLIDVEMGIDSSYPEDLTAVGSTLYFSASTITDGVELYAHTGAATTATMLEIETGNASTYPENLTNINGTLYFSAETEAEGNEPWTSDGTLGGTQLLKNIGSYGGSSAPDYLTVLNGNMYYAATKPSTGRELYKYNGTATASLIDIEAGLESSDPAYLTVVNNDLYFAATTAVAGRELYKYNGTNYSLIDIAMGASSANPENLVNVNGVLYFTAYSSTTGNELYKYDGTNITAIDIHSGALDSNPQYLTNVGGTLYFTATTVANGTELYKYDGTTYTLIEVESGGDSSDPQYLTDVNGTLYFKATTAAAGDELFKYSGTGTTATLIEIEPGPGGSFPQYLTAINDTLYCSATTLNNGTELYKYSGSTLTLVDIEAGADNSNPAGLTNVNNLLYFTASTAADGNELYKYDGANRTLLELISGTDGIGDISNLVSFNGFAYFMAHTYEMGAELYRTDGTPAGTNMVKDIWPGMNDGNPHNFMPFNGKFYFAADYNPNDSTYGIELWTLGNCTPNNSEITAEGEHLGYNSQIQVSPATQSCHCDVFNQLVTSVNATGTSPITGTINSKQWIDVTPTPNHVVRHYEINPNSNPTTATGKVTLYFTQAEFDAFNILNVNDLPSNSSDSTGKANLQIKKYNGISSNGTGAENTYTGASSLIDPADTDIVWNATASRWEVSFATTGFGGFFLTTFTCPPVSITGLNAAYCKTSGVITLAATPSGGTFMVDGNVATSFDTDLLSVGAHNVSYSYTVAGGCSGSTNQSFTLFALPSPPTITTTSNSVCIGASVTLTGVPPSGETATEYAWFRNGTFVKYSNTSADYTFSALAGANNYTLVIITSNSGICPSPQSPSPMIVTGTAPVSVISPSVAPPYCVGFAPTLNATPPTGTGYTYSWIGTSPTAATTTTATFVPTASGNHRVIVTDANGCSKSSAWMGIALNALPNANAGTDKTVCIGSSIGLGTTANLGFTYSWTPNTDLSSATSATPTATPLNTGYKNYTLTVTNTTTGCKKTDDVGVTIVALPATPSLTGTSSPVCQGATITLIPSGATGAINWYKNGVLSSAAATAAQLTLVASTASADSYTIRAKSGACLSVASNPVSAWIKPAPVPTLSATSAIISNVVSVCNPGQTNGTAQLMVNLPVGAPTAAMYNWQQVVAGTATNVSPAATTSTYTAAISIAANNKVFRAEVTYSNSCIKNTSNVTVKMLPSTCTIRTGYPGYLAEEIFTAYPNPTENGINVSIANSTASQGELVLYNTLGQVITSRSISLVEGRYEDSFDLSELVSGIYTLSFQTKDGNQVQKIVKE